MNYYLKPLLLSIALIGLVACDNSEKKVSENTDKPKKVQQETLQKPTIADSGAVAEATSGTADNKSKATNETVTAQKTEEPANEIAAATTATNSDKKVVADIVNLKNGKVSLLAGKLTLDPPKGFVRQVNSSSLIQTYLNQSEKSTFVIIVTPATKDSTDVLDEQFKKAEEEMKKRGASLKRIKQDSVKVEELTLKQLTLSVALEGKDLYVHTLVGVLGDKQINMSFVGPQTEKQQLEQAINQVIANITIQ